MDNTNLDAFLLKHEECDSITKQIKTGCGNVYLTVCFKDDQLLGVFSTLGKAGGCAGASHETISQLINLAITMGASSGDLESISQNQTCVSDKDSCYNVALRVLTNTVRINQRIFDISKALTFALAKEETIE